MAPKEEKDEESCLGRYDPRNDPIEFCNLIALILLLTGIVFVAVGYIVPRDYNFDPNTEARKMEAIEIYYADRIKMLDACIIVGMTFCGIGAVILASLLMVILCSGDVTGPSDASVTSSDKPLKLSKNEAAYYGSSETSKTPILTSESEVASGGKTPP